VKHHLPLEKLRQFLQNAAMIHAVRLENPSGMEYRATYQELCVSVSQRYNRHGGGFDYKVSASLGDCKLDEYAAYDSRSLEGILGEKEVIGIFLLAEAKLRKPPKTIYTLDEYQTALCRAIELLDALKE